MHRLKLKHSDDFRRSQHTKQPMNHLKVPFYHYRFYSSGLSEGHFIFLHKISSVCCEIAGSQEEKWVEKFLLVLTTTVTINYHSLTHHMITSCSAQSWQQNGSACLSSSVFSVSGQVQASPVRRSDLKLDLISPLVVWAVSLCPHGASMRSE